MSGTMRKDEACEARPKYASPCAYLEGQLFAPSKDKNWQTMRAVGR